MEGQPMEGGQPAVETQPERPVATQQEAPAERPEQEAGEPRFTQQDVDRIAGRARHEAVERYRRLSEEQPEYARQKYGEGNGARSEPTESPGSSSEERMRQLVAEEVSRRESESREELERKQAEQRAVQLAQDFGSRMTAARERIPDLDDVMKQVNISHYPNAVAFATTRLENTAEVMYELVKERSVLANAEMAAQAGRYEDAEAILKRFADSVSRNSGAAGMRHPREPLSQVKPSVTGMGGGEPQVRDLRSRSYLRG